MMTSLLTYFTIDCVCYVLGIGGILWKKQLKEKIRVTLNDYSEYCVEQIQQNCQKNELKHSHSAEELPENTVEVTNLDANIMLHQRQFNFVYV